MIHTPGILGFADITAGCEDVLMQCPEKFKSFYDVLSIISFISKQTVFQIKRNIIPKSKKTILERHICLTKLFV